MSQFVVTGWDGRIRIKLTPIYKDIVPSLPPFETYKFFTVLPYYNPLDSNGQLPAGYLEYQMPNNPSQVINILPWIIDPDDSDETEEQTKRKRRWQKIIEDGYGVLTLYNEKDFFSLFSYYNQYNIEQKKQIINKAIGSSGNNSIANTIMHILRYTPLTVIFVPYDSNGWQIGNARDYILDIFENTNFLEDYNFYIELGLHATMYVNMPDYKITAQQITSVIETYTERSDIISVFDADPDKINRTLSSLSYKKIVLSGWVKSVNFILPPSFVYALQIKYLESIGNKFGSIVNIKNKISFVYKAIKNHNSQTVHNIVNEVIGNTLLCNVIYKDRQGFSVFLTDTTYYISPNASSGKDMLKQENAVRAAIYAKRMIKHIAKFFLGYSQENIDYKEVENYINKKLENPEVRIYAKISEEENILPNTMIIRLYVEIGITIYRIDMEIEVSD